MLARRQPGSTLKSFVYELAFEKKLITPASLIDDSAAQLPTTNGFYLPQNYDHDFKGWVSARTALGASQNVPAVRIGAMLKPDTPVERFNALGLALPKPGGSYSNALALGSAEVTLLALTNAYRAFANGGLYAPVRLRVISDSTLRGSSAKAARVADAAAVFLATDILADNNARVRTFRNDSLLATRGFAAVKTGTSKDMRNNWCIGFTDRYTFGVWVGNASGEAMRGVSGVSGAAPVWQVLVAHLHAGRPSQAPRAPAGVCGTQLALEAQGEPPRDEFFIAGTEQALQRESAQAGTAQRFGITSPRDGSLFAIDPDIPQAAQRITFEGEHGTWVLDVKRLGASKKLAWAPWSGSSRAEAGRARRRGDRDRALRGARCRCQGGIEASLISRKRPDAGLPWATQRPTSWTPAGPHFFEIACRTRQARGSHQPFHRDVDDHAAQAVQQRADQRGDEAGDLKAIEHRRGEIEHQRVDDEQEQTECDHRDRQGQQHQDRPQQGVEQAQHEGRDQRRDEVRDRDARVEVGHQQQGGGKQKPANNDFHSRKNTAAG